MKCTILLIKLINFKIMCPFCNINKKIKLYLSFFLLIFLFSCSNREIDPVTGKSRDIEPNVDKRARDAADNNPIFGFGGKKNDSTTFSFATSNPLWRATLKSLDFLPLANADYQGGIIVYDWYSDNQRFNEQVKISVNFLSSEIRSSSINITGHKKVCDQNSSNCKTIKLEDSFTAEIKNTIINSARIIKIEEEKLKNK